jgi:hypothetical protein
MNKCNFWTNPNYQGFPNIEYISMGNLILKVRDLYNSIFLHYSVRNNLIDRYTVNPIVSDNELSGNSNSFKTLV